MVWKQFTSIIYWQDWNVSAELVHAMRLISCQNKHKKDRPKKCWFNCLPQLKTICVPLQFFYDWQILKSVEKIPISPPGGKNRNLNYFQITFEPSSRSYYASLFNRNLHLRIPLIYSTLLLPSRGLNSIKSLCTPSSHNKVVENSPRLSEHKSGYYASPYFPLGYQGHVWWSTFTVSLLSRGLI